MRWIASLVLAALLPGCFGYNRSAKTWAYVGDSVLIVGGGATLAGDIATRPGPCTGSTCPSYRPPVDGPFVAGAVLVTAGLVGLVINATRANVRTSR